MRLSLLTVVLLLGTWAPVCAEEPKPVPAWDWQTATPESQGMAKEKLDALKDDLVRRKTTVFLVIRNDRIVYEWYAPGHGPTQQEGTASLAKALVGGLALGVAITDGRITLTDKASKYIPQWKDDPRKSRIEIQHLGSHTSGLADAEEIGLTHDKLTGWKGDFWKRLPVPNDSFTLARDKAAVLFEPGKELRYSNTGIAMLTYATTIAIKDGREKDVRTLLRDRLLRPIGVLDQEWSVGYKETVTIDGLPLVPSWGGGSFTPRAEARLGRLILQNGDWNGKRLLSKEAVAQVTGSASLPGHAGMGWWTNNSRRYSGIPKDACWGAGAGDKVLLVIPSLNLVMVRSGELLTLPVKEVDAHGKPVGVLERFHDARVKVLFEPLVAAVKANEKPSTAPYRPSQVITGIEWAPKDSIIRKASGSDNWPLTWADDGHLYTAYGDGWGFDAKRTVKLSMGIARIEGGPMDFTGANIPAPTAEFKGSGKDGKKASGVLMVDGVLYMLVRNASNSQLAWSKDRGETWDWANWKFTTSFGCPTLLNFGKNYAGARDEYVYVYSHDADSAYEAADRMVLARVPKGHIKDREAYEFLESVAADGKPMWTKDIAKRGAVFQYTGKCYRSGITYNPALRRYLWCQILPGKDPRFAGGFGVYDSPEPWGPWTTVYHVDSWDVGPGDTANFPTKWMSDNGKTLHLVFSGDDHFSVRRVTLKVAKSR
jgi:CubicO group peptidase (beta-lactamase class C family)